MSSLITSTSPLDLATLLQATAKEEEGTGEVRPPSSTSSSQCTPTGGASRRGVKREMSEVSENLIWLIGLTFKRMIDVLQSSVKEEHMVTDAVYSLVIVVSIDNLPYLRDPRALPTARERPAIERRPIDIERGRSRKWK